jgi:hypothetical protein
VLGGTAGAFALKNYVLAHPETRRVGICQYRKFISRARISRVPEPSYPVMDLVHKGDLPKDVLERVMQPGDAPFLVSQPCRFPRGTTHLGLLEQYRYAHHVEDFLRFTAAAVDVGVLAPEQVRPFFEETWFFPGGVELGVYPADFWLRSIEAVEHVVRECVQRTPLVRAAYQARNWAFCAERLGSWLLLERFREMEPPPPRRSMFRAESAPEWSRHYLGQMNLVTEEAGGNYVLGR